MLGFDYARTSNPAHRLGNASGIVNVGGFVASLLTILLVGLLLDLTTSGGPSSYSLGAFRTAMSVQYVFWVFGIVMVLRTRRILRNRLTEQGLTLDPLHRAVARKWADAAARR